MDVADKGLSCSWDLLSKFLNLKHSLTHKTYKSTIFKVIKKVLLTNAFKYEHLAGKTLSTRTTLLKNHSRIISSRQRNFLIAINTCEILYIQYIKKNQNEMNQNF